MAESTSGNELAPLDQIRHAEADVTRRIAAARETAVQILARARKQADLLKMEAREIGQQEGQIHFGEIVSRAEKDASALTMAASLRAEELHLNGELRMKVVVSYGFNFVLGLDEEVIGK